MTPAPAPKRSPLIWLVLIVGGIVLALFCVIVSGALLVGGGRRTPAGGLTVEYRVGGSTRGASLTYHNASGGTEQNDVSVPWSQTISPARRGQFVYLAAQNQFDLGDVTCEIVVNGEVWKTARSGSDYGIATCSGALP
jgi:hypothetical protein